MIKKISASKGDSWLFASYRWSEDQRDAALSEGERGVLGTEHRIPTQEQCVECHRGRIDQVLGFGLVQLSHDRDLLDRLKRRGMLPASVPSEPPIPGDPVARKALGYLHANCAHCHNPGHGLAWPGRWVGLDFSLDAAAVRLEDQPTYRTAVNVEMFYDRKSIWKHRIAGGHPGRSAVSERMREVDPCLRMPPLGSQKVDREGLGDVEAWIASLGGAPVPAKTAGQELRDAVDAIGDRLHVMIVDATGRDSRRTVHECPHLPHGYIRPEP